MWIRTMKILDTAIWGAIYIASIGMVIIKSAEVSNGKSDYFVKYEKMTLKNCLLWLFVSLFYFLIIVLNNVLHFS